MEEGTFPCYLVRKEDGRGVAARIEWISRDDLPPGEVLIEVHYSSLNYKDAQACQGHPGVVRSFPHVPGIDCAGVVAASDVDDFRPGQEVLVTGYDLGGAHWGGYSAFVRVPAEWIVPMPRGLTPRTSMIYGTAGFTAAQSVAAIRSREIDPGDGPVLVTGATGGVGSIAVAILARLGYEVAAVTGKGDRADWLRSLGAATILSRKEVLDTGDRPMLSSRWAAAVDTVGGKTLTTILRSLKHRGLVAACGLVGGSELSMTVYPFLLRGVTLFGIDSAKCPRKARLEMWRHLGGDWRIDSLESLASEAILDDLPQLVEKILAGAMVGRTLVIPRTTAAASGAA